MTDPTIAGQVTGEHDIVDGLRFLYDHGVAIAPAYGLQAADEIERLRARVEELESATAESTTTTKKQRCL